MYRPLLASLLLLIAACTPAQQRSTGAVVAVGGLTTTAVGVALLDPCVTDSRDRMRECPERSNQMTEGAAVIMAAGIGLALVGGVVYLASYRPPPPASSSKPAVPSATPAPPLPARTSQY